MKYAGGCDCGSVRYESAMPPLESGYCHCRICQSTTGAPVLAFASFPVGGFQYVRENPTVYSSSKKGTRELCARCGTQIAYRDAHDAVAVDVNVATLDDPSEISPQYHIWCESRISWFDIDDSLPRYQQAKMKRSE